MNMHAARKPSSLAEKANSTASTGPITAMMVRDAWLITLSAASGKVTCRKGRMIRIDPHENRAHRRAAALARPRHGRRLRLGAIERDPRRRVSLRVRRAADRSANRRAPARHADRRGAPRIPEPEAHPGERRLLARQAGTGARDDLRP